MGVDLNRGFLVPRITEIMAKLGELCPPCRFPADADHSEEVRHPSWIRGGTSPSGADFGDAQSAMVDADYFIGAKYTSFDYGAPQRIVWVPPPEGQERFTRPETTGPHVGELSSPEGNLAFRRWASRVVPMLVHIWCNDYDDCDLLISNLSTAIFATNAGGPEVVGIETIVAGGYAEEQVGQRGIAYVLGCNFVFPITRGPLIQLPLKKIETPVHPVSIETLVGRPI